MPRVSLLITSLLSLASGFVVPQPPLRAAHGAAAIARSATPLPAAAAAAAVVRVPAPTMGLFGLGTPEIAIIAGVALLVLGPDQVKKLAKDVGKISAELKQVPEEFNKGIKVGEEELAAKKTPEIAEETPPSPPPAA